jgi:hypothetical protein
VTAPGGPVIPGPMLGADLWRQVTAAAGNRCECRGQCGRKHKDGQRRCIRENAPGTPLHAVPREPAPDHAAAALPASALHALCGPCDTALSSIHAKARQAASGALSAVESLF